MHHQVMIEKDLIKGCLFLYKRFNTIKAVVEETGLAYAVVSRYVKFDTLHKDVQDKVLAGDLKVKSALTATRALEEIHGEGNAPADEVEEYARLIEPMSKPEVDAVVEATESNPGATMTEIVEIASVNQLHSLTVKLSSPVYSKLDDYARKSGESSGNAAAQFIEKGLDEAGTLDS